MAMAGQVGHWLGKAGHQGPSGRARWVRGVPKSQRRAAPPSNGHRRGFSGELARRAGHMLVEGTLRPAIGEGSGTSRLRSSPRCSWWRRRGEGRPESPASGGDRRRRHRSIGANDGPNLARGPYAMCRCAHLTNIVVQDSSSAYQTCPKFSHKASKPALNILVEKALWPS
jgi:hypothetical protein